MTRKGFSLLELLVAVSIMALLLALSVVGLRGIRQAADHHASMGNLRSHGQVFAMYNGDSHGYFPYFTEVGAFSNRIEGGGLVVEAASYFDAHRTWHIALSDEYYDGNARATYFFPSRSESDKSMGWPLYTSYVYACSFIAAPKYWNPYTRVGPLQYRATRAEHVLYPSKKILLFAHQPGRRSSDGYATDLLAALCDGSAAAVSHFDRLRGYHRGDGYQFIRYGAVHFSDWPPFLHALDGVRGRDLR